MANKKHSEFTQTSVTRKKSEYEIYNDLRTAIGAKKMAEKLGVHPATERRYFSLVKNKLSGGGIALNKSVIKPKKVIFKKTKKVSKKISKKDIKIAYKKDSQGKRVKIQNHELTKDGKLRQTKKVQPKIVKGIQHKAVSDTSEKKLAKEFKKKNFSGVVFKYHYEYVIKAGKFSNWATVVYYGKSLKEALKKLNSHISAHKKAYVSILYSTILEIVFEIIHND